MFSFIDETESSKGLMSQLTAVMSWCTPGTVISLVGVATVEKHLPTHVTDAGCGQPDRRSPRYKVMCVNEARPVIGPSGRRGGTKEPS